MTDNPTSTALPGAAAQAVTPALPGLGRFVPGTLLASRYKIVALLGAGGMGEVYRADDLTLGQPVALKFLPPELAGNPERLVRFRAEVRTARQVSHPNVCRVYDILESEGYHFLSMEYVDGEDLASLLRRIGRLPQDKGIEIARQLCAGLAAAHDRHVLHRDLKPANVMVDGRGHARITDFGIATIVGDADQLAGTPSYLAPELLHGQPPTTKSDLYALGLVLHEIFTGKPVFAPGSLLDIAQAHRERDASQVTTTAPDLDPALDRVVARCLDPNPDARPASALAVAAALPGGDPLAVALARGETPAPEVVAAAGGEGALRPAVAATLTAAALILLFAVVWANDRTSLLNIAPMPLRPDVLRDRAEQLLRQVGYPDAPGNVASGFELSPFATYLRRQRNVGRPWERARRGQPSAVRYWYRSSPGPLVGERFYSGGRVSPADPAQNRTAGMITVQLDTQGRLLRFFAVARRARPGNAAPVEPDWTPLFAAAGFDRTAFRETESRETPIEHADVRKAWEGVYPDSPDVPIRIEAAAADSRAFYFRVVEPWMGALPPPRTPPRAAVLVRLLLLGIGINLGVWLAARNLRLGRGDATGATRVGIAVFAVSLSGGLLGADYAWDLNVLQELLTRLFTWAIAAGAMAALFYLALEPPVRRRWPTVLIGWTRFTRGQWRDPRVGRDVLIGVLAACFVLLLMRSQVLLAQLVGVPLNLSAPPVQASVLDGGRFLAASVLEQGGSSALQTFTSLLGLFTLTFVVRRLWIAALVGATLVVWILSVQSPTPLFTAPFIALTASTYLIVLLRVGLLAHITAGTLITVGAPAALTLHASAWYAPYGWAIIAVIVGLAMYGFRTSLGGRSLFRTGVLAD